MISDLNASGDDPQRKILTGDYVVDEKHRNITVSDEGWEKVEGLLGIGNIADPENWRSSITSRPQSRHTRSIAKTWNT